MLTRALLRATLRHRGWRYRTRVDPAEIGWLRQALRRGDLAVDIGAYKGGYTYWMRSAVGAEGHVIACEPQPELAEYLRRCVRAFAWANVVVEEAALAARTGRARLLSPEGGPSPGASLVGASLPPGPTAQTVRTVTLDALVLDHPALERLRLIKCDVEGGELDVFLGGKSVLAERRPLLLFECEDRHLAGGSVRDVFGYLEELGYRGGFFRRGEWVDVERFDAAVHQVDGTRPYVNNFVFAPVDAEAGAS